MSYGYACVRVCRCAGVRVSQPLCIVRPGWMASMKPFKSCRKPGPASRPHLLQHRTPNRQSIDMTLSVTCRLYHICMYVLCLCFCLTRSSSVQAARSPTYSTYPSARRAYIRSHHLQVPGPRSGVYLAFRMGEGCILRRNNRALVVACCSVP